jgi:MFS family permease
MASAYRPVLARPGAARLLSSAVLARLPQGMSSLAILLLVHGATHSYAAAGIAVGLSALTVAISMPIQGGLVDRLGIARVVAPAAVGQALAYVLLGVLAAVHAGALALILCAALVGAVQPPVSSVVRASLSTMFVDHAVRESAFALEFVLQEVIFVSGPLLITLLITLTSPGVSVYALAVIGFVGSMTFLRSPLLAGAHGGEGKRHDRRSALRSVDLRWLLLPVAFLGFGLGCLDVGIPSLALHLGSRPASGVLLALWSLGSMIGGLWFGTRTQRSGAGRQPSGAGRRYVMLMLANVVFLMPYLLAGSIVVCGFCSVIAGLAIAPIFSCQYSVATRVIHAGTENEAFSWILSGLIAGAAAGSALSGVGIGAVGSKAPFILACSSACLGALASLRFRRRFPDDPPSEPASLIEELAPA